MTLSNLRRWLATRDGLLAVALVVAFSVCYAGVCRSLVHQWMTNDVYAHGFLIPLISLYILYERKARLRATPIEPHLLGGSLILAAGLTLLLIGQLGGIVSLAQISLLVSLTGTVWLLCGPRMVRESWIPLAYLLFMIPVWEVVTNEFQGSFQLISADIGAALLRTAGIPVRHDGVILELPNVTLRVAEACSGVNFVVAILALSIPQAYLMLSGISLRLFVAVFAVIVALLTNGLRVAVIGLVAYSGLSGSDIHGPGHILQGLSVAVIGFIAVFATIYYLARRTEHASQISPADVEGHGAAARPNRLRPAVALGCSLAFLSVAGLQAVYRPVPVELAGSASTFPMQLGGWHSVSGSPQRRAAAGADARISRRYANGAGRTVELSVLYYAYQVQDKEIVTDDSRALHAGSTPVSIPLPDGSSFVANQVSLPDGSYTVFWYDLDGRQVAGRAEAKLWTVWNTAVRRHSNGALIALSTPRSSGDPASVAAEVKDLAGIAANSLRHYLPRSFAP